MTYPTPEQWRAYAAHARKMADEYHAEGCETMTVRRDEAADFYEQRAQMEEARLMKLQFKEAAE